MKNESPDPPTKSPDTPTPLAQEPYYPQLNEARHNSVRLVISIPVLFLLVVLGMGSLLYVYLNALSQRPMISYETSIALERAAVFILLLSMIISLVASLVGFVLARQITRPIRDIMGTMEAIASGDFSTKLEPVPLGEIGQLGTTFNRMVQQLDHLFQERDRQLRESFGGAHLIVDRNGTISFADDSARRLLGLPSRKLLGANLFDPGAAIPILNRNPRLLDTLETVVKSATSGEPVSRPVSVRDRDGRQQARYLVSSIRLDCGEEQQERILIVLRDISGMYNFYEQIQRADRLAAIGTLATGIAHEIRNPLASIRGMTQLLNEFEEKPEGDAQPSRTTVYTERILRDVDRLEKLIAGIMDLAQTGEVPHEETDLNMLLRETVESARYSLPQGREAVTVNFHVDERLPICCYQIDRVRQAFLNLVVNAMQHCLENSTGPVRVETKYDNVGNRPVRVVISNPGGPIDETTRERIFEPFYTSKAEGTGLGVPIAYQAINMNGGQLELESEGGMIRFVVSLPRDSSSSQSSSRIIPRLGAMMPQETPLPGS